MLICDARAERELISMFLSEQTSQQSTCSQGRPEHTCPPQSEDSLDSGDIWSGLHNFQRLFGGQGWAAAVMLAARHGPMKYKRAHM